MTLSADKLNLRSPYHLSQVNEFTFRFVTDQQISYTVGFYKVKYYAGILLRHDHPLHDMILAYYQDFLKNVPVLYTIREK